MQYDQDTVIVSKQCCGSKTGVELFGTITTPIAGNIRVTREKAQTFWVDEYCQE
jgi:hypothetical protein